MIAILSFVIVTLKNLLDKVGSINKIYGSCGEISRFFFSSINFDVHFTFFKNRSLWWGVWTPEIMGLDFD